jgi:hypothetical protein
MSTLNFTHTLVDGNTGLGVKIMQNFTDAKTVLNGGLDGGNFASGADIHAASMEANTKAVVAAIEPAVVAEESYVEIPTVGTAKLEIQDSTGAVLFQIDVDGHTKVGA